MNNTFAINNVGGSGITLSKPSAMHAGEVITDRIKINTPKNVFVRYELLVLDLKQKDTKNNNRIILTKIGCKEIEPHQSIRDIVLIQESPEILQYVQKKDLELADIEIVVKVQDQWTLKD